MGGGVGCGGGINNGSFVAQSDFGKEFGQLWATLWGTKSGEENRVGVYHPITPMCSVAITQNALFQRWEKGGGSSMLGQRETVHLGEMRGEGEG